jgi:hypothetical protein
MTVVLSEGLLQVTADAGHGSIWVAEGENGADHAVPAALELSVRRGKNSGGWSAENRRAIYAMLERRLRR